MTFRLTGKICKFVASTSGNIATVTAVAFTAIGVASGAAIDLSRASGARSELQGALDTAVLGAVIAEPAKRNGVADRIFQAAFSARGLGMVAPAWTNNPDGSFSGAATVVVENTLMKLAGRQTTSVSANATAINDNTGVTPPPADINGASCIYVLDPDASQALLVNSPVAINAPNCRIEVFSQANPAAIFNSGFSHNLKKICVKGSNVIQNGGSVTALETGCAPKADPFAGKLPLVSVGACTVSDQNYSGLNNLLPGVYCGNFNFNGTGTLNLSPGLYVLKNTRWNLNSGWKVKGSGVTFYLADSNSYIQINGGVEVDITAPVSGTYKNILMFERQGLNKSSFTINGSAGHRFEGLFYLPSRNITFNSVSTVQSEKITMVFNTLILDHIDWQFDDSGAAGSTGGSSDSVALTSGARVRLVR